MTEIIEQYPYLVLWHGAVVIAYCHRNNCQEVNDLHELKLAQQTCQ